MCLLCSGVPVTHGSVTVNQNAQQQDPETEAVTWNSAMIEFHYLHRWLGLLQENV